MRAIEASVPTDLDVHLIVDNYSTHKHPKVKVWLAARPRWHLHFVPTYSSWLNLVERIFALITGRAIRRGSFSSVRELIQRIDHVVTNHNTDSLPSCKDLTCESTGQHTSLPGRACQLSQVKMPGDVAAE